MKPDVISIVLNNFVNDARVLKEALTLKGEGYRVKVVCLHDSGLAEKETVEGVDVHRIKMITRKLPSNIIFSVFKYLEFGIKVVFHHFRAGIYHCHDLNVLPVGAFIKVLRGRKIRLIYDAHELETEQVSNQGKLEHRLSVWLEKQLVKKVDRMITVSPAIAEEYSRRLSVPLPELILNCPPYQRFTKTSTIQDKLNLPPGTTLFLYQGGLSAERGIENMLEAFSQVAWPGSALVVMGYGPLEKLVLEYSKQCDRIFLLPAVSQRELPSYTSSADYGILFYENTCLNNYYCLPNKLFEYLMSGVPVLVSPLYELKKIVESNHLGLIARAPSVEGMKEVILATRSFDIQLFKDNIMEFNKIYNWENQAATLIKLYKTLCAE
ncbi:MAG: glycosyltransferase [Bacteroidetes bacterium]|nr:glycosyltransferase [Bacteroidota bacterium]